FKVVKSYKKKTGDQYMKIIKSILIILCAQLLILSSGVHAQPPSYAKWGQIAMKETKARYPNADIIDYQHIGRDTGTNTSTEKFKLWLRSGTKEFGVFIDITFENSTEKITDISFRETTREAYNAM